MSITPAIPPVPEAGAQPLTITLPGGLVVMGVAQQVGATTMTQALSLIGAANSALAPLGPIFKIIDAVLAVKAFAESVPGVVLNPGDVITAISDLVAKIAGLSSLIPQLSVPLMVLGAIDAIISLLTALAIQLEAIAIQEERITAAREAALTLPDAAQEALEAIADAADESVEVQRADVATTLSYINPLIGIINLFCQLVGLPEIELAADPGGTARDAADSLNAAADVLRTVRSTIPV